MSFMEWLWKWHLIWEVIYDDYSKIKLIQLREDKQAVA